MIVATTIELSPETYRYYIEATKEMPDICPEDFMSIVLALYAIRHQSHVTMTKAERDMLDRLRREGKLRGLL